MIIGFVYVHQVQSLKLSAITVFIVTMMLKSKAQLASLQEALETNA